MTDPTRPSENVRCIRHGCPGCGYVAGFLPADLSIPCPRCKTRPASEFVDIGYGPLHPETPPGPTP